MPEPLRIGVIGASWYSEMRHLPALQSHPRAQTVAICDIDRDRAEEMAARYDIPLDITVEVVDEQVLFSLDPFLVGYASYDVDVGAQRFMMLQIGGGDDGQVSELIVVQNFFRVLRERLGN